MDVMSPVRSAHCSETRSAHAGSPVAQAVPLLLGIAWEARLRREFLLGRGVPLQHLGRFWAAVLRLTRAQPAHVPHPRAP